MSEKEGWPPVIAPEVLLPALGEVLLLDARTGADAAARHAEAHLPGARFVALEEELAAQAPHPEEGGRHPFPPPRRFAEAVGRWGIDPETRVVIYDAASGANAAARAWLMLRSLGHRRVHVLEGGIDAARAAGAPLTADPSSFEPRPPYPSTTWRWPTVDLEAAITYGARPDRQLLDARSAERYRGEQEPIDPVAGHIPGARNLPFPSLLDERGRLLPRDRLRSIIDEALDGVPPERAAVYCGSGVTACFLLLAMEQAGRGGAALYVGSFSEYCRRGRRIAGSGAES